MKVEYNHAYCVFEDVKSLILGVTCLKKKQRVRVKSQFCTIFTDFWYFLAFKKRSTKIRILIL